jgi:chromate transporter
VGWLRENDRARAALDGINAAVVGLMAGVLVELTGTAFPDPFAVVIGALALVALLRWRLNSVWLIATGVAIGLAHGVIS